MESLPSSFDELQFVTITDLRSRDVAQQKTVRKLVMCRYWRGIKEQGPPRPALRGKLPLLCARPSDAGVAGDKHVELDRICPACMREIPRNCVDQTVPVCCPECGVSSSREGSLARSTYQPWISCMNGPRAICGNGDRDPFASFSDPSNIIH